MITPKFFVTGIWKIDSGSITHFCVHPNGAAGFGKGQRIPASELVRMVKAGQQVRTLRWNYQNGNWTVGELLVVSRTANAEILSVRRDASSLDNLQNLINLTPFHIAAASHSNELRES